VRGQIPEHANTEATGPEPMSRELRESRGGQPVAGEAGTLCLLRSSCRARARSRQHPLRNPSSGAEVLWVVEPGREARGARHCCTGKADTWPKLLGTQVLAGRGHWSHTDQSQPGGPHSVLDFE